MSERSEREIPEFVPIRMLNEFTYCPRLFYLEWVQGEFADNVFTVDGRERHRAVDRREQALPAPGEKPSFEVRSVALSSKELGLSTKVDVIAGAGADVTPVDYKRGRPPDTPERTWEPERVQVCAQGLILREHGYTCNRGVIYFAETKERIEVPFTDALVARTKELIAELRRTAVGPIPRPLVDSPKCNGCSLHAICLPDEVNRLAAIGHAPSEPREGVGAPPPEGIEPESGGGEPMRRLFAARDDAVPLYVQRSGLVLGLDGEVIQVHEPHGGGVLQEARLLQTSQVCVFGNVSVSPHLIRELCDRSIPLLFFSYGGWFYGRIEGLGHKNAELRIAQFAAAREEARCLSLARGFVRSKTLNARTLLRRNHEAPPAPVLDELASIAERTAEAMSLPTLRGLEGNAARAYFGAFSGMLRPPASGGGGAPSPPEGGWRFDLAGRNRRPPRDPVNALLSFAYALLTKDWSIAVAAAGLDPYVGFYHQPRYGRPALALDLMEEFRPLIADSTVLQAINQGVITVEDFVQSVAGVALKNEARRKLLQVYERRMDQLVTHPAFGYRLSYRRVLEVQARLLSRHLLGELPAYPEFRTR